MLNRLFYRTVGLYTLPIPLYPLLRGTPPVPVLSAELSIRNMPGQLNNPVSPCMAGNEGEGECEDIVTETESPGGLVHLPLPEPAQAIEYGAVGLLRGSVVVEVVPVNSS